MIIIYIALVFALIVIMFGFCSWRFKSKYLNQVLSNLKSSFPVQDDLLTEQDIQYLPDPVKKYLHVTGVLNKPRVKHFKTAFTGKIRSNEQSEWMPFTCEQYNFIDASTRLFFMKATMKHLPVAGFHCFVNGDAFMDIRLFSLFRVQYQSGKEMGIAETVTFFNDMCFMAPATLIDKRIKWLETNGNKVRAEFTNNGITISAWLIFNDQGELINFISEDRFAVSDHHSLKRIPWSTPVKEYKDIAGYRLIGSGDAIYSYPEGDLCYITMSLTDVQYNGKN